CPGAVIRIMRKLPLTRFSRRCATLALGATLASAGAVAIPASASADSSQIAMIQDNLDLVNAPAAMAQFRELGANAVRVIVPWSLIAPRSGSKKKPKFNANDPTAYPARNWAPYDNIARSAATYGLKLDFTVSGGAPLWAESGRIPGQNSPFFAWN